MLALNPDAAAIARQLDQERKNGQVRGPLHGIPILVKDNIETRDPIATTAGSLALADWRAPQDAFVAARLRAAGAIILGKTNLSEWANFRSTHSTSGWSGRGGQTKNPYALDRNPSGSSSGSGAAACQQSLRCGHRQRDRWIGHQPVIDQWDLRHQAHRRTRQPLGHHPHFGQPGHGRSDGAHRSRRRHFAECDGGAELKL